MKNLGLAKVMSRGYFKEYDGAYWPKENLFTDGAILIKDKYFNLEPTTDAKLIEQLKEKEDGKDLIYLLTVRRGNIHVDNYQTDKINYHGLLDWPVENYKEAKIVFSDENRVYMTSYFDNRHLVLLNNEDISVWVAEKYYDYLMKIYKEPKFFIAGEKERVYCLLNDTVKAVIMPSPFKGISLSKNGEKFIISDTTGWTSGKKKDVLLPSP